MQLANLLGESLTNLARQSIFVTSTEMNEIDLNNNLHCTINLLLVNWHSYYLPQRGKQLNQPWRL